MKTLIFQITISNIWRISALKVLKLNISWYRTIWPDCFFIFKLDLPFVLYYFLTKPQINFLDRNPTNIWGGNLENRCPPKFILTIWPFEQFFDLRSLKNHVKGPSMYYVISIWGFLNLLSTANIIWVSHQIENCYMTLVHIHIN